MESLITIIPYIIFSYLLGSILIGYFIARILKKKDFGKNDMPGTAGTYRQLGLVPAFLVLSFDFVKGFLVPWVGILLGFPQLTIIIASFAVVSGHNWPLFFKFSRGGGGIVTSLGAALFLFPQQTLLAALAGVFGIIFHRLWLKKISSISRQPFPFAMTIGLMVLVILALFFKREANFLIFIFGIIFISLAKAIELKLKEKEKD